MKYFVITFLMLAAGLLQGLFFSQLSILGAFPNMLLVTAVCWSMVRSHDEAMLLVLVAGLALGLTASDTPGLAILSLTPAVILTNIRHVYVLENRLLLTLSIVIIASLAYYLVEGLTLRALGYHPEWAATLRYSFLPQLALNLALTPVVYGIIWLFSPGKRYEARLGGYLRH